jgi:Flp pilus assembly protein TadG
MVRHVRERGSSLVELAIGLLLLVTLLAVIVDAGIALNRYIIICNASREGARYAALYPGSAGGITQAVVSEAADSGLTLVAGDVSISGLNGRGGSPIRVTVVCEVPTVLGSLVGRQSLTIRSMTEMVIAGSS